jgi:integrase/recombinase XerC
MRRAKYFTKTPYGTRGSIRIEGTLYQKHFRTGTDPIDMRQWLVDTELEHRIGPSGPFAEDARRYLLAVAAMSSYADRKRHIEWWVRVFPEKTRKSITSAEIAAQLQTARLTKSASTCNHLRTALQHLWTTLDGKAAKNPVRDVPKFHEPSTVPRALTYTAIRKILRAVTNPIDRARLTLIAYAGLPNALIASITPAHINRKARTLALPGRKKGHGTRGQVIPLRPEALAALKVLDKHKAFGPFSRWHLRKVFKQACVTAKVTNADKLRPYDLRHSFATEVYKQSGDLGAVQTLMFHSTEKLTRRYALAAVNVRARKALKDFGA